MKTKYMWIASAIPFGILSGFLIGLWSVLIGNDFGVNFLGALIGQSVAHLLIGAILSKAKG